MSSSAYTAALVAWGVLAVLVALIVAAAGGAVAVFLARGAGENTSSALLLGGRAFAQLFGLAVAVLVALAHGIAWIASR